MDNRISSIEKLFKEFDAITGRNFSLRKKLIKQIGEALSKCNKSGAREVISNEDMKHYHQLEIRYDHLSGILELNPEYFDTEENEDTSSGKRVASIPTHSKKRGVMKYFPYPSYRPNQLEGIEKIRDCASTGVPLILDSPTGTGKSIMVLSGLLNLCGPDDRIVVLTRTHSQYDAFIKEARLIQESGTPLNCGILAGREGLCPIGVSSRLCSKAKYHGRKNMKNGFSSRSDRRLAYLRGKEVKNGNLKYGCPYFVNTVDYRLGDNGHYMKPTTAVEKLLLKHKRRPYQLGEFREKCLELPHPVCPYEAMKLSLKDANVMILHYLYFFDSDIQAKMLESEVFNTDGAIHLVIDEGHNAGFYIIEMNTHKLSLDELEGSVNFLENHLKGTGNFDLKECAKEVEKSAVILGELTDRLKDWADNNINSPLDGREKDYILCVEYFEKNIILSHNGSDIFSLGKKSLENILQVNNAVEKQLKNEENAFEDMVEIETPSFSNVTHVLKHLFESNNEKYVIRILTSPKPQETLGGRTKGLNILLEIKDADPRGKIQELRKISDSLTLISGTFSPINKFQDFLFYNEAKVETHSVPNPFPKENRKILTLNDVTSLYRARNSPSNNTAIENTLKAICNDTRSSAIFFTSYSFLNDWKYMIEQLCEKTGKKVFYEKKGEDKKAVLKAYQNLDNSLLVGVLGGSFSEGINLPGDQLNRVAVIGLQLAPRTQLQNKIEAYYNNKGLDGVALTYNLPAVTKSIQALGRCIRSETDKGILILADNRYTQPKFKQYLPNWIRQETKTITSKNLSKEIQKFNKTNPKKK